MATLNLKSIGTIVSNQAATVQANSTVLIDFSVGSILRAVAEANAAVAVWLQGLVLVVLQVSRLATSQNADVDSFVNDFGLSRLPSSGSSGSVTFSRYSTTQSAFVPVGAQVQSADGTQTFTVLADPTNIAYNAALSGFLIASGVASVSVEVVSVGVGPATNVVAGAINRLLTSIQGVDYVSNASACAGGSSGETDAALKLRFVLYILGLSKGNVYGIEYALASLNVSISYTITDQYNYAGVYSPGFFYVVVDDGSGYPSSTYLAAATVAVQSSKPLGVNFSVFGPAITTVNVNATITSLPGYTHTNVAAAASAAIAAGIQGLGLGNGLDVYQISQWVLATPGVAVGGVAGLTLNGLSGDAATIVANNQNRLLPGTITVA